jgi:hypothetical protein
MSINACGYRPLLLRKLITAPLYGTIARFKLPSKSLPLFPDGQRSQSDLENIRFLKPSKCNAYFFFGFHPGWFLAYIARSFALTAADIGLPLLAVALLLAGVG